MENKKSQKNIFLENEGDNWFERNKNISKKEDDEIVKIMDYLELKYNSLLEIGCSTGYRLNLLKSDNKDLYGIDPSAKAIEYGLKNYKNLKLSQGTADSLNFESDKFEVIIFGFCLYLVDRDDLFKIAFEADRVIKNNGHIIILDFEPPYEYKNEYHHKKGVFTYKMDYSKIFSWNSHYTLKYKHIFNHGGGSKEIFKNDTRVSISVLFKNDLS